jgi:uncharacterized membrane protein YjjP (DUF1212 family)
MEWRYNFLGFNYTLKHLWYNPIMDFIIGFLLGYFLKEISSYLKRISKYDLDSNIDKEWDFLSRDDLP